jgi:HK97 family phage prohead protease
MPKQSSNAITREQAAADRKTSLLRDKTEDRHGMHLARGTHPIDVDVRRVLTFSLRMQPIEHGQAPREAISFPGTAAIRSAPARVHRAPKDDDEDKPPADDDDEDRIERADIGVDDDEDRRPDKDSEWCHLSGVASVVETPYQMWDIFGPYTEKVSSRAFDASLARGPDVAFLVNHGGLTMARTRAGTLLLAASPSGLAIDAWLNKNRSDVANLAIAIKEGSIDQMSFAAFLEEGEWNEDFTEFTILRLDLECGDVSAVNFGANPHTSIAQRAHRFLEEIDNLPDRAAREALKKLEARYGTTPQDSTKQASGRSLALVRSALLAGE